MNPFGSSSFERSREASVENGLPQTGRSRLSLLDKLEAARTKRIYLAQHERLRDTDPHAPSTRANRGDKTCTSANATKYADPATKNNGA